MNNSTSIIIDWFGPYNHEDALSKSEQDYDDGLYMLIGKTKYQKTKNSLQYIGIAKDLSIRLKNNQSTIDQLSQKLIIWLGEISSYGVPGRKIKSINRCLDLAEWAHIYFLNLPLNQKKKSKPPDHPVTILNRWWRRDYKTPFIKRPHTDWPDLIDFIGTEFGARICWFGSKVLRRRSEYFE